MTTAPRRPFIMQYRAEDFPLYLLSLVLGAALIVPALPHYSLQILLLASLVYLGVFFVVRHGAKFDPHCVRDLGEGLAQYPALLWRNWKTARHAIIPIALIFAIAIGTEMLLRPRLPGTFWLRPFPWQWAIWGPFLLVTLFRLVVMVAHLLRASRVREVMERSPQRKTIAVFSIPNHVLQAFLTGLLGHLSLVAPCVLFFLWTQPTVLREALLLGGFTLWTIVATPLRKKKVLTKPGVLHNRLVYSNHLVAHQSRFFFTVFHGHHHDALPSALIGSAAGTGFLENTDRGLTWLDFLKSIILIQFDWAWTIAFDMVVHQYIPGVFPFAKPTVTGMSHHVTHHFGSAMPLGIIFSGYVEPNDMQNGYKPDNNVTRWFLSEVERLENITPEMGQKFLSLNDYAARKAAAAAAAPVPAPVAVALDAPSLAVTE
jgi:hypothetical protein